MPSAPPRPPTAGQKSFEHLIGVFEGSSTVEDELMKGPKGPARFLDTYDAANEAALIQLLAKKQTWQCPTLYWERGQWLVDAIDVVEGPRREVRAGLLAREELAEIHGGNHQGPRHGSRCRCARSSSRTSSRS